MRIRVLEQWTAHPEEGSNSLFIKELYVKTTNKKDSASSLSFIYNIPTFYWKGTNVHQSTFDKIIEEQTQTIGQKSIGSNAQQLQGIGLKVNAMKLSFVLGTTTTTPRISLEFWKTKNGFQLLMKASLETESDTLQLKHQHVETLNELSK